MKYFRLWLLGISICLLPLLSGCYSLTGASISGKTINVRTLENRALNVAPTLSTTLTDKLRNRILSQTGLAAVNAENADYDLKGTITGYAVSLTGVQTVGNGVPQATQNRLTITVEVDFKNRLDEKASFKQSFSRFYDFNAQQQLQAIEAAAIEDIGNQIADDIFNKAFVNW
ncbi:LptE family protein [Taibaiella koreensis]|uniref:LptE family protein n=1 Tax=Taibaiella koreensis TaxID=1268548 RepID=UPI000E59CB5E|nr:LptE family protein [Taibaiella koreensis]